MQFDAKISVDNEQIDRIERIMAVSALRADPSQEYNESI